MTTDVLVHFSVPSANKEDALQAVNRRATLGKFRRLTDACAARFIQAIEGPDLEVVAFCGGAAPNSYYGLFKLLAPFARAGSFIGFPCGIHWYFDGQAMHIRYINPLLLQRRSGRKTV